MSRAQMSDNVLEYLRNRKPFAQNGTLNEAIVSRSSRFCHLFLNIKSQTNNFLFSDHMADTSHLQAYTVATQKFIPKCSFLHFLFSSKIQYHFNLVQMSSFKQYFIHFGEAFLCSYFCRREICDVWRQADTIATLIRFYERPSSTLFSSHRIHEYERTRNDFIRPLNRLCLVALSKDVSIPYVWLDII